MAATQLLDWIVDKDGVFELGVDTSDGALSAELASAAIKSFPNLRTLALDGKQILAKVLRRELSVLDIASMAYLELPTRRARSPAGQSTPASPS